MQRTPTYIPAAALLGISFHPIGPVFSGPARQVTQRPPPHTFLGTLNGVEWLCYRLPSDTDAEYARRVEQMREAFTAASRRASRA